MYVESCRTKYLPGSKFFICNIKTKAGLLIQLHSGYKDEPHFTIEIGQAVRAYIETRKYTYSRTPVKHY